MKIILIIVIGLLVYTIINSINKRIWDRQKQESEIEQQKEKPTHIGETTIEETTKVVEQEKDTKYSELNFIKVKRLKKEFGDHVTKATISIVEKDGPEYVAQMNAIDDILTELKLAKKVENLGGLEELYDFFIEDIETTVDMLIAEYLESEEYYELHKKVMELDEKFLNEYHRIEDKLKE